MARAVSKTRLETPNSYPSLYTIDNGMLCEVPRVVKMNNKPVQSKCDRFGLCCDRGGFALATMLCAVVILFVLGGALLSVGMQSRALSVRTSSGIAARCAADAGLTKAVYGMNEKLKVKPWNESGLPVVTNEQLPNTNATYSYSVSGDPVSYTHLTLPTTPYV